MAVHLLQEQMAGEQVARAAEVERATMAAPAARQAVRVGKEGPAPTEATALAT